MSASDIAALDSALVRNSQNISLRLVVDGVGAIVDCRATVSNPESKHIAGDITVDDYYCILSPTEINAAGWPGNLVPGETRDMRIPKDGYGYSAYIDGSWRAVKSGKGFYPGGELSRIEMFVQG